MPLAELGHALRQRREALGMSRAVVARRLGVSPSYVWLVERAVARGGGRPTRPSQEVLQRWAEVLRWDAPHAAKLSDLAGYPGATAPDEQVAFFGAALVGSPDPSRLEVEVLLDRARNVMIDSQLAQDQRTELFRLLDSFISWLAYTSSRPEPPTSGASETHSVAQALGVVDPTDAG